VQADLVVQIVLRRRAAGHQPQPAAQVTKAHNSPRGFAPRTPLHTLSRAASPARSVRVAHSLRSFASCMVV
jgi:hypothetical protein